MEDQFPLLHISDLHRSPEDPISNDELVSALLHDRDRYVVESPPIAPPEAIVVSGDLIEGVPLGSEDFQGKIEKQYTVAEELLCELADRFLDGDRTRLIVVPGNHDVDWNTAFAALECVEPSEYPTDLAEELKAVDSIYRWDWRNRALYRIVRQELYESRLGAFQRFCERFYNGLGTPQTVNGSQDDRLYELFEGSVSVAAFSSCEGNDCFAHHGRIKPDTVARSDLGLRDSGAVHGMRLAVWHHNIEGAPYHTDYMDVEIVRGMIGRGFRLGLHGHQHKAQAQLQEIRLPSLESMVVVSAGSLCAGPRQLPTGTHRQYNVIEIAGDFKNVRTHVRAMEVANVFSRANLLEFGGGSFMDIPMSSTRDAVGQPIDLVHRRRQRSIEVAEYESKSGRPERAVEILRGLELDPMTHERQLFLDSAHDAKNWIAITDATNPPTSISELVLRFRAQCELGDLEGAKQTLDLYCRELGITKELEKELRSYLNVEKVVNK